jgi:hypothetical protein
MVSINPGVALGGAILGEYLDKFPPYLRSNFPEDSIMSPSSNVSNSLLSFAGITPGAALVEKKSVRDLAANFAANKIGELLWRQPNLLSPSFRLTCMNIFMIFPFPFMHFFAHETEKLVSFGAEASPQ